MLMADGGAGRRRDLPPQRLSLAALPPPCRASVPCRWRASISATGARWGRREGARRPRGYANASPWSEVSCTQHHHQQIGLVGVVPSAQRGHGLMGCDGCDTSLPALCTRGTGAAADTHVQRCLLPPPAGSLGAPAKNEKEGEAAAIVSWLSVCSHCGIAMTGLSSQPRPHAAVLRPAPAQPLASPAAAPWRWGPFPQPPPESSLLPLHP